MTKKPFTDPQLPTEPEDCLDTEQVPPALREKALLEGNTPGSLVGYLLFGILFGVVLVKSEVVSWFRIQEMFRFDSIHMYGIIGLAVIIGGLSIQLIKRLNIRTIHGEPIEIPPKDWSGTGTRYWAGGIVFGLGWALLGACPGPIFALIGSGISVMILALLGALVGTWSYAFLSTRLPH